MAQSIEQFGQTIKQKYPQYADIPDAELGQKMLKKYPQYQDMVTANPTPEKKGYTSSPIPGVDFLNENLPKVGEAIISSERGVGETLGQSWATTNFGIKGNKDFKNMEESTQGLSDMQLKVQKQIIEDKKMGKDTSKLEAVLKKSKNVPTFAEIVPATQKTNAQAIGEVAGVGLDLLTAGTYGKAASGAKFLPKLGSFSEIVGDTAKLTKAGKVAIPTAAKVIANPVAKGVVKFAGRSLAGGLLGEGFDIASNLQQGKTGLSALTDGYGKYIGLATPAIAKGAGVVYRGGKAAVTGTIKGVGVAAKEGVGAGVKAGAKEFISKTIDVPAMKQALTQQYNDILNLTKNQSKFEQKYNKDTAAFLAERPYLSLTTDKNNKLVADTAIEALKGEVAPEQRAMDKLIESRPEHASIDQLRKDALAAVEEFKGTAHDKAIKQVNDEFDAYERQYASKVTPGGPNGEKMVPVAVVNEIKKDLWGKSKFNVTQSIDDQTRASVNYRMGHSAKDMVEKTVPDADISHLNKQLGDYYAAIEMLEKRNGLTVPGGKIGKYSAKMIGAVAGSHGGFFGTVLGAEGAGAIHQILNDPAVTTSIRRAALDVLREEKPTIAKQVEEMFSKEEAARIGRKALPPGNTIIAPEFKGGQSGVTAPTKPGGLFEHQQNIEASQKAALGKYAPPPMTKPKAPIADKSFPGEMSITIDNYKGANFDDPKSMKKVSDALLKNMETPEGKEVAKTSQEFVKNQNIKYLYRYGDNNGMSWTTKPDPYFQKKGESLNKIKVTPDIVDRIIYADGIYKGVKNSGEAEVILKPIDSKKGKATIGAITAGAGIATAGAIARTPGKTVTIENTKEPTSKAPDNVPEKYKKSVIEASTSTKVDPAVISAIINVENGKWNPTEKRDGGTDTGLGQHTDTTYKDINKLFKAEYGKNYDRKNADDSIKATALWIKHLMENPNIKTIDNAIRAYRIGVTGFIRASKNKASEEWKMAEQELKRFKSFMK